MDKVKNTFWSRLTEQGDRYTMGLWPKYRRER